MRGSVVMGPVLPWRLPSVMWKHIYTGAMGSIYINLVVGMFLAAYGRHLGVSYRAWGILAGLSSFAVTLQLVGAHAVSVIGKRREIWFYFCMGERLARGLAVVSAYHLSSGDPLFTSVAFVFFLSLGSALGSLSVPPWMSWLADLFPADIQGKFWGRREAWVAFATLAVMIPAALLFDFGLGCGFPVQSLLVIFSFGLALGYIDLFIHRGIPEPPMKPAPRRSLAAGVRVALVDRSFRPWLALTFTWNFSLMLGASMMTLFFVGEATAGSFTLMVLAVACVPMLMQLLTAGHMGRLVDSLGTRRVLFWSHLVWSLLPVLLLFVTPANAVFVIAAMNALGMPAVSAAINAATKYLIRFPPDEDRATYFAVAQGVGSLGGGLGALAAGEVLQMLSGWSADFAGLTFDGFRVLFAVSIVLRLASTMLVKALPAPACDLKTALSRQSGAFAAVTGEEAAEAEPA